MSTKNIGIIGSAIGILILLVSTILGKMEWEVFGTSAVAIVGVFYSFYQKWENSKLETEKSNIELKLLDSEFEKESLKKTKVNLESRLKESSKKIEELSTEMASKIQPETPVIVKPVVGKRAKKSKTKEE